MAFECSGSPKSYETFWKLIAPGGAAVIVGIPVNPVAIDITELQATEVRIENIFRYANVYQKAIDLVANGKLNLKPFITDTYAMEDAQAAFDRSRPRASWRHQAADYREKRLTLRTLRNDERGLCHGGCCTSQR